MAMVVFLPPASRSRLRTVFPNQVLRSASSWSDLAALMGQPGVTVAVIDPDADGATKLDAAVTILRNHPLIPTFAYVSPTPTTLRSVLQLSKHGLENAFLCGHPDIDRNWQKALELAAGRRLVYGLLRAMETRIRHLPFDLKRTLIDLFERPHGYDCVTDIACEAGISVRCLYKAFERAGLGSPKKMLTIAKLARGYSLLVSSSAQLPKISYHLRYSRPRLFSEAIAQVFGSSPLALRRDPNPDEAVLHLLEWLYRPTLNSRNGKQV
jgi:AraC-like DNA-binding protein